MKIAVYCSARTGLPAEVIEDARTLGNAIGKGGHTLVYGGLSMGMMDVVSCAVAEAGGKVTGVVPATRQDRENPVNSVNILVNSLHERKQIMEENADLFVALDGGYGTLDEIMSALATMSFFNEPKPLLVLNRDNLYTPLQLMFNEMETRGLMTPQVAGRISFHSDIASLLSQLHTLQSVYI